MTHLEEFDVILQIDRNNALASGGEAFPNASAHFHYRRLREA